MAPAEPFVFAWTGGELCLDFANTVDDRGIPDKRQDHLTRYRDFASWSRQAGLVTAADERTLVRAASRQPRKARAMLGRAVRLREAIYSVFSARAAGHAAPADALAALNTELAAALSNAAVKRIGEEYRWAWHDDPTVHPEKPLWAIVKSAADLLTSDRCAAVRECAAETCGWLFLDTSRNRSRRWCDMKVCGNREKVRRFYERVTGDRRARQ